MYFNTIFVSTWRRHNTKQLPDRLEINGDFLLAFLLLCEIIFTHMRKLITRKRTCSLFFYLSLIFIGKDLDFISMIIDRPIIFV